jgi:hypothetical protein
MAWVKRNLIFVIAGVIAVLLLGGGGFYLYRAWDHNTTALTDLNTVVDTLKNLTGSTPSPGNEKVNNTEIARQQDKEIRAWNQKAVTSFAAISPIPEGTVSGASFSGALQKTIAALRRDAETEGVTLPPKFDFSFTAERDRLTFSPAGLEPLAVQLGEVAAISRVLFAARVNAIDSIQRVRVSDDDLQGPPTDYLDSRPTTNDLAVITPYVITVRCFTHELSAVLSGFATGKNAFIVRAINVQPASAAPLAPGAPAYPGGEMPAMPGRPMMIEGEGAPNPYLRGAQPVPPQPVTGKGGLQTALKEQLLRATIEVNIVKLTPKK